MAEHDTYGSTDATVSDLLDLVERQKAALLEAGEDPAWVNNAHVEVWPDGLKLSFRPPKAPEGHPAAEKALSLDPEWRWTPVAEHEPPGWEDPT